MSAEDQIKEAMGTMYAVTAPQRSVGIPVGGAAEGDTRLALLEQDIRNLHNGLVLASRQIDHLAAKISGS